MTERSRGFTLSAVLMVAGFALNAVVTLTLLPSEEGDDHVAIFTAYADSGAWVAAHLVQFVAILLGLAGLFVLARALRPEAPHLAALAAAGAVTTAAAWALVQAVDGVALKLAIDAWVDASRPEEATRFANAETVLWTFAYGQFSTSSPLMQTSVCGPPSRASNPGPPSRASSPWLPSMTSSPKSSPFPTESLP